MKRVVVGTLAVVTRALGYGLSGAFLILLAGFVLHVNSQADLSVWHTADLDAEFTTNSRIRSFDEYLDLEDQLFEQLDERVYQRIAPEASTRINRFHHGSLADPERWPRNWNRSYQLTTESPRVGVLLIHGMSDSPYSLRNAAERLHEAGAFVLGLRVPGHGTAPVGLTRVHWQDMAAAVQLAARHLRDQVGDRPLFAIGYSNGATLSLHYALSALTDDSLPRLEGILLLSPEIGISPAAAFAVWQDRIGRLLGLRKLAWNSVLPEYDPFKYQSFAVNAGDQAYRLTQVIAAQLTELGDTGQLEDLPRVLAFQSAVDATVSTPAVIEGLMSRLSPRGHELVIFDLNRMTDLENLLKHDPKTELTELLRETNLPFMLRVVTNETPDSRRVALHSRAAGGSTVRVQDLGLDWPDSVFSLSHVALPFPPEDPLYGDGSGDPSPGIQLGRVALRGERGVLQISASEMLRERSNPFYPYIEQRMLEFVGLAAR